MSDEHTPKFNSKSLTAKMDGWNHDPVSFWAGSSWKHWGSTQPECLKGTYPEFFFPHRNLFEKGDFTIGLSPKSIFSGVMLHPWVH